jgi:transcriptional regulator with XRE-family HTH domain
MKNRIGNVLRSYRFLSAQEQDELAAEIGISQPVLSELERGMRKPTSRAWDKIIKWMKED